MKEDRSVIVAPDVGRITEGLRDTGYDFDTAVADLIDNSIAAGATFIDIRVGLRASGVPIVAIGDNGWGMNRAGLINCMRYGSPRHEDPSGLGKFGLGLKTASTAFCRRLVVASRAKAKAKPLQAVWDLDRLAQSGKWEMELGAPDKDILEYLDLCSNKGPGTVVVWQNIDRILCAEAEPSSQSFASETPEDLGQRLGRICESLGRHLSMVFQRYLDPAHDATRTVQIFLNDSRLTPWDPGLGGLSTGAGTHILTVTRGDDVAPITVTARILPREESIEDPEARANAHIDSAHQGIYVYRENRLIHGPDWLGIQSADPAWNLLRVTLSFDSRIDDVFMVDIKKSRVLINEALYAWLKDVFLPPLLKQAETRWRQGAAQNSKQSARGRHSASDTAIAQQEAALSRAEVLEADLAGGEILLRTNSGNARTRIFVVPENEVELDHIHTSPETRDDALYEPALINGKPGLSLKLGHPFYHKVYMPNEGNSPLVQGLDMLFWALAQAELNNLDDASRQRFAALREEFARNLAKLVHKLPDPE